MLRSSAFISPCEPTLRDRLPKGVGWLYDLVERAAIGRLLHSETFEEGDRLLAECGGRGLERVVAKHRASIYRSGRSTSWMKVKCPAWREANRDRGKLFGEAR